HVADVVDPATLAERLLGFPSDVGAAKAEADDKDVRLATVRAAFGADSVSDADHRTHRRGARRSVRNDPAEWPLATRCGPLSRPPRSTTECRTWLCRLALLVAPPPTPHRQAARPRLRQAMENDSR